MADLPNILQTVAALSQQAQQYQQALLNARREAEVKAHHINELTDTCRSQAHEVAVCAQRIKQLEDESQGRAQCIQALMLEKRQMHARKASIREQTPTKKPGPWTSSDSQCVREGSTHSTRQTAEVRLHAAPAR